MTTMLFVIKTVDGAELVGETEDKVHTEAQLIYVKDPLEIIYQQDDMSGATGATFQRYNYFGSTDTISLWKHAIVSMYPANEIMIKAHADTLSGIKKEKAGIIPEDKKESLREALAGMLEKISGNTTVH